MSLKPLDNEKDLLAKIAAGNQTAFTDVVNHYWNKIFQICLTYTKSYETAEDVAQDIFFKIWQKKETLPSIERFDNYLFIVTRNEVVSAMRKMGPRLFKADDIANTLAANEVTPEDNLNTKRLAELIEKGVKLLSPQQQIIWRLSRESGLSHEEIAAKLGLSKNTVKVHLVRALNTLRFYLTQNLSLLFVFFFQ